MGVRPYKSFTFDGESSLTHGVYLTGEGVFNAPERAVEMLEIPGRNGAYALDQGRFENITVTYRAGMVDYSESDFATRISDVRNWLCSKVGYKRLEDDYNPNEYRMAVYLSGIEVDHEDLQTGEFDITFNCKPQRWLTSGETAISVTSGDTITNPTLFDAQPLLAVKGYGNINLNGFDIDIENVLIGEIKIGGSSGYSTEYSIQFDNANINVGDTITLPSFKIGRFAIVGSSGLNLLSLNADSETLSGASTVITSAGQNAFDSYTNFPSVTFTYGTSSQIDNTTSYSGTAKNSSLQTVAFYDQQFRARISYSGGTSVKFTFSNTRIAGTDLTYPKNYYNAGDIIADSTKSALGNPTYIDCEIGEAYLVNSDVPLTLNNVVYLGAELPKLAPGSNGVTYDNTVTELAITPRWWKV